MIRFRPTIGVLAGLLAFYGVARGQEERGELPEGIRQLIRAADQAEQQVRKENGGVVNEEAERRASRSARQAARQAINDYWLASFEYNRRRADVEKARTEAEEAQNHLLTVQSETTSSGPRLIKAQEDADGKLRSLADAEMKLEQARIAWESTRLPAAAPAPEGSATDSRPKPPEAPQPDYYRPQKPEPDSAGRTAAPEERWNGRWSVYSNEQGSFHLRGGSGSGFYSRLGQSYLTTLRFRKDSEHFLFYRAESGDPTIIEWAFAKYPEFPSGGEPMFAVWCHDRAGWHWEWARRDGAMEMPTTPRTPTPPAMPMPGPAAMN
ncbi:MAG TPA: hypothetical protein VGY55_14500 [Pirellulales bacterium]|jgi:hypothetical protein|nr:hypothetical protein [Pirellulales bacterium]